MKEIQAEIISRKEENTINVMKTVTRQPAKL